MSRIQLPAAVGSGHFATWFNSERRNDFQVMTLGNSFMVQDREASGLVSVVEQDNQKLGGPQHEDESSVDAPVRVESPVTSRSSGENAAASAEAAGSALGSMQESNDDIAKQKRLSRYVPWTNWNKLCKVGPFEMHIDSKGMVHSKELKFHLYRMESSKELDSVDLFCKYLEEGYVYLPGVFDANHPQLARLRQVLCDIVKEQYNLDMEPSTMTQMNPPEKPKSKRARVEINRTFRFFPELTEEEKQDDIDLGTDALLQPGLDLLDSQDVADILDKFVQGASGYHSRKLKLKKKYSWARLRGPLKNPRYEWTEYYFFKHNEVELDDRLNFDRRFAREITRRKVNPKPRYAFQLLICVADLPIEGGGMALLPGSHLLSGFTKQVLPHETPVDFKKQAKGMPWVGEDMKAGDAFLVDMQTTRAYVGNRKSPFFLCSIVDNMYFLEPE